MSFEFKLHHLPSQKKKAHLFRRSIHISLALTPWIFLPFKNIPSINLILFDGMMIAWILEVIRLKQGKLWFGQRPHEQNQFSSWVWTITALSILFIMLPELKDHAPIIIGCALADPLIGSCRLHQVPRHISWTITLILLFIIWYLAYYLWQINPLWSVIMPPIILLAEGVHMRYLDDNALMILIPCFILKLTDELPALIAIN